MDTLAAYMRDLSHIKVLKNEEAVALLPKVRAGDKDARNQLIESCLRLALLKVKKATKIGQGIDDEFLTEANIAVCNAVDHWDGVTSKLSTYVGRAIEYAIISARLMKNVIHIPQWADRKTYLLSKTNEPLSSDDQEVCDNTNKAKSVSFLSFLSTGDYEGNDHLFTPVTVDRNKQTEVSRQVEEIAALITRRRMPQQHREIVRYYYGLNGHERLNIKEIGKKLGLTRGTTANYLKKALQSLEQRRKCVVCGEAFDVTLPKKIYCSLKCRNLDRRKVPELMKERPCKHCGKMFKPYSYATLYCTYECYKQWRAETGKLQRTNRVICKFCGNEFVANRSDQLYCSKQCISKDRTRKLRESRVLKLKAAG